MIPKKIHYCWFGGNPYPELVEKCIESWKKYLPDYELVEWNETNFDLNSSQFVKEAYEAKKFAFVSDYVRLYALYNYGGIYMDTDVEVVQNLDKFLTLSAFTGRESDDTCITGTMGAVPHHKWIQELLDYYQQKSFFGKGGMKPNTVIITETTNKMYTIETSPDEIYHGDSLSIYPFEYFCAKLAVTGEVVVTENTYTIHHFNGSWLTKRMKIKNKIVRQIRKRLGVKVYNFLRKFAQTFKK